MIETLYSRSDSGLLLVDPYNDFLSEGGKLNGLAKAVADRVGTVANLTAVLAAVRRAGIQVFYVPHHRARPGDFSGWKHPSPYQLGGQPRPGVRRGQLGWGMAPCVRAAGE